jgi:hypothetical protein
MPRTRKRSFHNSGETSKPRNPPARPQSSSYAGPHDSLQSHAVCSSFAPGCYFASRPAGNFHDERSRGLRSQPEVTRFATSLRPAENIRARSVESLRSIQGGTSQPLSPPSPGAHHVSRARRPPLCTSGISRQAASPVNCLPETMLSELRPFAFLEETRADPCPDARPPSLSSRYFQTPSSLRRRTIWPRW